MIQVNLRRANIWLYFLHLRDEGKFLIRIISQLYQHKEIYKFIFMFRKELKCIYTFCHHPSFLTSSYVDGFLAIKQFCTWTTYIPMMSLWYHLFYQKTYPHFPTLFGETKTCQWRKMLKSFNIVKVSIVIPHTRRFLYLLPKLEHTCN